MFVIKILFFWISLIILFYSNYFTILFSFFTILLAMRYFQLLWVLEKHGYSVKVLTVQQLYLDMWLYFPWFQPDPGVVCSGDNHDAFLLSRMQFWCFSFENSSVNTPKNASWLVNLSQQLFAAIVTMCFMIKRLTRELVFPWITSGSSRLPTPCATAPFLSMGS